MTEAWIGFVHVRSTPNSDVLEGGRGGYAHVLALVDHGDGYRIIVDRTLADLGLVVAEITDVAPVESYRRDGRMHSDELQELEGALCPELPVQFKTFDTYPADDA